MVEMSKIKIPMVSTMKIMKIIDSFSSFLLFSSNSLPIAKQTAIVVMNKPIHSKMAKQIQTKMAVGLRARAP